MDNFGVRLVTAGNIRTTLSTLADTSCLDEIQIEDNPYRTYSR